MLEEDGHDIFSLLVCSSHHGLLSLDGLDLQTLVLLGGSVVVVVPLIRVAATQAHLAWRASLAIGAMLPRLRRRPRVVATLLLGDVRLGTVHCLHVLPQGAGVRVALGAARDFAHVRFLKKIKKIKKKIKRGLRMVAQQANFYGVTRCYFTSFECVRF